MYKLVMVLVAVAVGTFFAAGCGKNEGSACCPVTTEIAVPASDAPASCEVVAEEASEGVIEETSVEALEPTVDDVAGEAIEEDTEAYDESEAMEEASASEMTEEFIEEVPAGAEETAVVEEEVVEEPAVETEPEEAGETSVE